MTAKMNRRNFVKSAAISSLAARARWLEAKTIQEGNLLFAGTQTGPASKGIYAFEWNASTGALKELGLAAETNNPTFIALAPDSKHLYAANEIDEYLGTKSGSISGFSVDRMAAKLTLINTVSSTAAGPCHVAVDQTGRTVLCANYSGSGAASFHVDTRGHLSEAVSQFHYTGRGPNPDRQQAPHAHRATVSPDNRFVYINDLGLDCIHIYRLDAATSALTQNDPPQWTAKPGSGPRALHFHPNKQWAFCVHEMACALEVLAWKSNTGALTSIDHIDLLPKGFNGPTPTASEVAISGDGLFAYAAVRGYDKIATLHVNLRTGKLSLVDHTSCGGKTPRYIALDPTDGWLLIANQDSDNIAIFRRDKQSGKLEKADGSFPLVKPQCLVFA